MKPISRSCGPASAGTGTLAPYCPDDRSSSSSGSIPASRSAQSCGSSRSSWPVRAGQVPRVQEDVCRVEAVDRLVHREPAEVRVLQHPPGRGWIVEQGLHRGRVGQPGGGRVVGAGTPGQLDPRSPGQQGRQPLDQVLHHVPRPPARHRGRRVPVAGAEHALGEPPASCRWRSAGWSEVAMGHQLVELGVALVDPRLHAAAQPGVAPLEAVDERLRVQPGAAVAEVLEAQGLAARPRPGRRRR